MVTKKNLWNKVDSIINSVKKIALAKSCWFFIINIFTHMHTYNGDNIIYKMNLTLLRSYEKKNKIKIKNGWIIIVMRKHNIKRWKEKRESWSYLRDGSRWGRATEVTIGDKNGGWVAGWFGYGQFSLFFWFFFLVSNTF